MRETVATVGQLTSEHIIAACLITILLQVRPGEQTRADREDGHQHGQC